MVIRQFLTSCGSSFNPALRFINSIEENIPLFFAKDLNNGSVSSPSSYISFTEETKNLMIPIGIYLLVRRFSPKESKSRILSAVLTPTNTHQEYIALDNKINYFHKKNAPLEQDLAYGLFAYLNSSTINNYINIFNGLTQVNANDLKELRYPSEGQLKKLGKQIIKNPYLSQKQIDDYLNTNVSP